MFFFLVLRCDFPHHTYSQHSLKVRTLWFGVWAFIYWYVDSDTPVLKMTYQLLNSVEVVSNSVTQVKTVYILRHNKDQTYVYVSLVPPLQMVVHCTELYV